ncbi:DUF2528 family protein [Aliarcobacter butzleri]|uniref:DUF2528 family protein n=1 Tax=Aliarcobacter butzleri TaxID=28197 RepID=A0AAW7PUS9_9BACT|nr:DUF2528 family protein [Aliarcobacter butzleri]MDN5069507.1 DUF2528 family protein [Aliarcobacter butzleri]
MKKIEVKVTLADVNDFIIIFDENEETYKLCHEINDFWSGNKDRLYDAQECIYKCVARLIAHEIIRLQMKSSFYCGEDAAIKAFKEGIEGFPPIDGSCGIKLKYCEDFELKDLDVSFERKTIEEIVS